jgi:hypothetical protein
MPDALVGTRMLGSTDISNGSSYSGNASSLQKGATAVLHIHRSLPRSTAFYLSDAGRVSRRENGYEEHERAAYGNESAVTSLYRHKSASTSRFIIPSG